MTISSQTRSAGPFTGTGALVAYPFSFKVFTTADLLVYRTDLTGTQVALALSTDYTVTLNLDQNTSPGGTVNLLVALPVGYVLNLTSNVSVTQPASLTNAGGFFPKTIEDALDRLTVLLQQYGITNIGQALRVPEIGGIAQLAAAASRANNLLGFDSLGNVVMVAPASGSAAALAIDLLNFVVNTKGAGQIGYNDSLTYPANTVGSKMQSIGDSVLTYGAKIDGTTDSASAFNTAGATGRVILVPELAGGLPYVLNSDVSGLFYAVGAPRFSGAGKIGIVSRLGTPKQENNYGLIGGFPRTCSVLMIGDSITAGTGASLFTNSYGWLVARSLMNASDRGIFYDWGIGYHRILNIANLLSTPGVTTTGSANVSGVWGARLNLTVGQSMTFSLREIKTFDVLYDASASAGATFTISLNGTVVKTVVVSGSGLKSTFPTVLKSFNLATRLTDVITITSTVATTQICGAMDLKNGTVNDMLMYVAGQSGYAYQDYNTTPAMDELAFYLNNLRTTNDKVLVCNLGTNNMYNAGKALSPSATITAIDTFVTGMKSRCTNLQIAIAVPPKSNESLFPMILSNKYEEYVRAIVSYGIKNNLVLIRHDLSALSSGAFYSDGLHPNDIGHKIFAETVLDTMKVKYDAYFKAIDFTPSDYLPLMRQDNAVAMTSTWGGYGALPGFAARSHLVNGMVTLSGVVIPNGSGSTQIGTLSGAFTPDSQDRYFLVPTNVSGGTKGTATIVINHSTGTLVISAIPTNDVVLDGISFPANKFIDT